MKLVENEMAGANPTVLFYTTQMEETYARLLAGKSKPAEPEPEPEPVPVPVPEPEPEPAQEGDAVADGADGSPAAEGGDAVVEGTEGEDVAAPAEASGEDGAEASAASLAEAPAPVPATPPPPPPAKRGPPPLEPADLLELHVCVPSALPDAACESGLVYFTLMVNEPIVASGDSGEALLPFTVTNCSYHFFFRFFSLAQLRG